VTDDTASHRGLSLTDIDGQRSLEEKERDGKSGDKEYLLRLEKKSGTEKIAGKVTQVDELSSSSPVDLRSLKSDGFTHFGIFRLSDRSTTTVVQDESGELFKVLVLGRGNVQVSCPVVIELAD
jgi:hypothetical protein